LGKASCLVTTSLFALGCGTNDEEGYTFGLYYRLIPLKWFLCLLGSWNMGFGMARALCCYENEYEMSSLL
jgi:hypothetical protein